MHYIPNCKPPPPLSLYLRGYPRLSESPGLRLRRLFPHPHPPVLPISLHRLSTRTPDVFCPFLPSWSHVGQILSSPTLSLPALLLGLWSPISLTHPHLAVRGIFVKHKSNHVLLLRCIPCFSSVLRIGSYLLLVLRLGVIWPLTITISACLPDCLSSSLDPLSFFVSLNMINVLTWVSA